MKKSKTQLVKDYIKLKGSITAIEGDKIGVRRLADTIYSLDKQGWVFNRISVTLTDDFGYTAQYTKYIFVSEPIKK